MTFASRKLFKSAALAVGLIAAPIAQAADVNLVTAELPPFANGPEAADKGVAVDLVAEMAQRAGMTVQVTYEPWKRAVSTVKSADNTFLAPPFRTAEREGQYGWVTELFPAKQVFVTLGAPVNSAEEARGLGKIAVLRGSIMEKGLTEMNFTNLHAVTSSVQAVKMVQTGRADAWYAVDLESFGAIKEAGFARADFTLGASIVEQVHWLASNKSVDPATNAALSKAMEDMHADGTYDAIVAKYFN